MATVPVQFVKELPRLPTYIATCISYNPVLRPKVTAHYLRLKTQVDLHLRLDILMERL